MRRVAWPLAFALWVALAAPFAWRFSGDAPDDVFITYRYAQNLAAGRGFVFNPGERVFGLTDPGLGAALGALHAATGAPIPLLGTLATAAALIAIAALLFAGATRRGRSLAAVAAGGGLITASGYLWAGQGSGPVVALALLLTAAALGGEGKRQEERERPRGGKRQGGLESRDEERAPGDARLRGAVEEQSGEAARDLVAGVVAGLAISVRPDAALGAAILGVLLIFERRRIPWRFALGLAATVAVAALAAFEAFGTVIPATLLAKRQMAALAAPGRLAAAAFFWRRAVAVAAFYLGPLALPVAALGVAGQAALWRGTAGRPGRLLAGVGLGTILAYTVLGVPFFTWYLAPAVASLLVGAALAAGWLLANLRDASILQPRRPLGAGIGHHRRPLAGALFLLLSLAAVAALASPLVASARVVAAGPRGDWRRAAYVAAGRWLRAHSRPDERVALEEVGLVAYTADRRVLDLVGLVSPSSLPYAAVADPLGAFLAAPTDYVLFHTFTAHGGTVGIVQRPWFPRAYALAARLDFPTLGGSVFLYRRRPGVPIPPPRPPFPAPKH